MRNIDTIRRAWAHTQFAPREPSSWPDTEPEQVPPSWMREEPRIPRKREPLLTAAGWFWLPYIGVTVVLGLVAWSCL